MPRTQTIIIIVGLILMIAVVVQAVAKHWIPFAALLIFVLLMGILSTLAARMRKEKRPQ